MRMAKYCKEQGMSKQEYYEYKESIELSAETIKEIELKNRDHSSGMYYPLKELLQVGTQESYYIIDHLKTIGFEFINDYSLFRIV